MYFLLVFVFIVFIVYYIIDQCHSMRTPHNSSNKSHGMPQNKVKQPQQHKNKQKSKCNNGTIEEQKDIKQVHSEKVHVKIVEQWDTHVNNVHKDQEKYVQNIQVQILLLMMLRNKLIWIGKEKEIDGMGMIQKCIKKLLRSIGSMRRLGSRLS